MKRIPTSAIALTEPAELRQVIDFAGRPFRIVKEISRTEYDRALKANRDLGRVGQYGTYETATKRYEPMQTLPEEFRYCYVVEPAL